MNSLFKSNLDHSSFESTFNNNLNNDSSQNCEFQPTEKYNYFKETHRMERKASLLENETTKTNHSKYSQKILGQNKTDREFHLLNFNFKNPTTLINSQTEMSNIQTQDGLETDIASQFKYDSHFRNNLMHNCQIDKAIYQKLNDKDQVLDEQNHKKNLLNKIIASSASLRSSSGGKTYGRKFSQELVQQQRMRQLQSQQKQDLMDGLNWQPKRHQSNDDQYENKNAHIKQDDMRTEKTTIVSANQKSKECNGASFNIKPIDNTNFNQNNKINSSQKHMSIQDQNDANTVSASERILPSSSMNQLYKGEKARNLILQNQIQDLKQQIENQKIQIEEVESLKNQNKNYQELILRYEEQSELKEEQLRQLQDAIKDSVTTLELQNVELQDELIQQKQMIQQYQNEIQLLQSQLQEKQQLEMELINNQQHSQDQDVVIQDLKNEIAENIQQFQNEKDEMEMQFNNQIEILKYQYDQQLNDLQNIINQKNNHLQQFAIMFENQKIDFDNQLMELQNLVEAQIQKQYMKEKEQNIQKQNLINQIDQQKQQIQDSQKDLIQLKETSENQINKLQNEIQKLKVKKQQNEEIIQRQTINISQLVSAAQQLKDKHKSSNSEKQQLLIEKNELVNENLNIQKYADMLEIRIKEVSKAEEIANQKLLQSLEDVQNLTLENQDLLQMHEQIKNLNQNVKQAVISGI